MACFNCSLPTNDVKLRTQNPLCINLYMERQSVMKTRTVLFETYNGELSWALQIYLGSRQSFRLNIKQQFSHLADRTRQIRHQFHGSMLSTTHNLLPNCRTIRYKFATAEEQAVCRSLRWSLMSEFERSLHVLLCLHDHKAFHDKINWQIWMTLSLSIADICITKFVTVVSW